MKTKQDREKRIEYCREWYKKNKEKKLKYQKEYHKKTNYTYEKTLKERLNRSVKRKTRKTFSLKNQKCFKCGDKATEHHHNTLPIEFNKFKFVCHKCHIKIEREIKNKNICKGD